MARSADIPPEPELKKMTTASLVAFNEAILTKDFTRFREGVSTPFKEQFTAARMLEAFSPFVENKVDLSEVATAPVIFDADPQESEPGVLVLQGHFKTPLIIPHFSLKYYKEPTGWKLLGINVNLKERPALPAPEDLKKLVRQTLLDFNAAVQARDFTDLHRKASSPLREQTTPQKLREVFRPFIENNVDISAIKDMDPKLENQATVDDFGVLVLEGQFATKPVRTAFRTKHYYEKGEWKLLGVTVDTTEPK